MGDFFCPHEYTFLLSAFAWEIEQLSKAQKKARPFYLAGHFQRTYILERYYTYPMLRDNSFGHPIGITIAYFHEVKTRNKIETGNSMAA